MIFIREAAAEDIPKIAELEKVCFPVPWSEEAIEQDVLYSDIALVLVAEYEDRFAGYLDVWRIAGEGQLNNIAVVPELRGNGIGTGLMEEMIERLRDEDFFEISLEVRPTNGTAIGMYQKLGFEQVGQRNEYYSDDQEDALIFKLTLNDNYSGYRY